MDSDRGTTSVHGTAAASAGKTQRDNGRIRLSLLAKRRSGSCSERYFMRPVCPFSPAKDSLQVQIPHYLFSSSQSCIGSHYSKCGGTCQPSAGG